ncbi:MAG: YesL family protein [Lachnospiraceae bacterium]
MENGFFGFMNRIGDIVFLNLVFLITCIPVVTIGNSLIALYCVSLKMAKGEEGYVVRGYFKAFKDNFKKGIIVGISLELILAVLIYDAIVLLQSDASYAFPGFFITVVAIAVIFAMMQYLFPLIARYENTIRNSVKNALLLAISKLPYTILLVLFPLTLMALTYLTSYAYCLIIVCGCSLCALWQSKLLNRIFKSIE